MISIAFKSHGQIDCEKYLAFGVSQEKLSDFEVYTVSNDKSLEINFKDITIAYFKRNQKKFLIKELFNNEYLLISFYNNIGAAGPELMKRESVYVIPLLEPKVRIFKVQNKKAINFTFCIETLDYHKHSESKIYAIEQINETAIDLIDNHGEKVQLKVQEIPYPVLL